MGRSTSRRVTYALAGGLLGPAIQARSAGSTGRTVFAGWRRAVVTGPMQLLRLPAAAGESDVGQLAVDGTSMASVLPEPTSILRGWALSAIGMRRVSTPAW